MVPTYRKNKFNYFIKLKFKIMMKNSIFKVLTVLFLTVIMFSCNKENDIDINNLQTNTLKKSELQSFINASNTEEKILDNYEKSNNIENLKKLSLLVEAFKKIVLIDEVTDYIYNNINKNSGLISVSDIIAEFPEVEKNINSEFKVNKRSDFKCYSDFISSFNEKGIKYFPTINIPNILNAEKDFIPIISAGIEIPEDMDNKSDFILAYKYDNKDFLPIYICEEEAIASKAALYVLSLNSENEIELNKQNKLIETPYLSINSSNYYLNESKGNFDIFITSWKATQRFDNTKKSEITIAAGVIKQDGSYRNPFGLDDRKLIEDMDKSKIGLIRRGKVFFSSDFYWNIEDQVAIFFNSYERDWYASIKDIGKGTKYGTDCWVRGRMSGNNDTYVYDASNRNLPYIDYRIFDSGEFVQVDGVRGLVEFNSIQN